MRPQLPFSDQTNDGISDSKLGGESGREFTIGPSASNLADIVVSEFGSWIKSSPRNSHREFACPVVATMRQPLRMRSTPIGIPAGASFWCSSRPVGVSCLPPSVQDAMGYVALMCDPFQVFDAVVNPVAILMINGWAFGAGLQKREGDETVRTSVDNSTGSGHGVLDVGPLSPRFQDTSSFSIPEPPVAADFVGASLRNYAPSFLRTHGSTSTQVVYSGEAAWVN